MYLPSVGVYTALHGDSHPVMTGLREGWVNNYLTVKIRRVNAVYLHLQKCLKF